MYISAFIPNFFFRRANIRLIVNKFQMQARRGVLALTAGSDLVGRRNVGKVKRTKYCEVYKAYFFIRGDY